MRGRARWLLGAGLVIGVTVVVFVVAQGGGGGGPLNAIAKAARVTRRVPGGRAVFHLTVRSATTPEGFTENGTMSFDDDRRTRSTVDVTGLSSGREGKLLVITDGGTSYLSSDLFDSLPHGKKWMEIDLSSVVKGPPGSSVSAQPGPEEGLKVLEKVIDAEEKGKEVVGGVPTIRYSGTLPVAEEVFGVEPDISASDVEVWIDAHDRVRRMKALITGGLKGNPDSVATTKMTTDFVEFGRVPTISLPPTEEVVDVTGDIEESVQSAAEGG